MPAVANLVRMSVAAMCRDSVNLERQNVTQDGAGATRRSEPWSVIQSNIRCDIQPASASVQMRYERRSMVVSHTVYFFQDIDANEQDRLRVSGTSRFLRVQGYRDASAGRNVCWAADCEEHAGEH